MHWVEQLGANHEVVRVACSGERYLYRVVPYRRSWIAEERRDAGWTAMRAKGLGAGARSRMRMWRSPQAAMHFVDTLGNGPNGGADAGG